MTHLKEILLVQEGLRLLPYHDSRGFLTIGVGRNLTAKGISRDEAFFLLDRDIRDTKAAISKYPWFSGLADAQKDALSSMLFNLGPERFALFTRMLAALEAGDYERAAQEMLSSKWREDVGQRAQILAEMVRTGAYAGL